MNKFTAIALAAALTFSSATVALAGSLDALSSASSVSFSTVQSDSNNILLSSGGRVMESVDIDSLRARVSNNKQVLSQLESYGAGVDDVIGITGSTDSELTLYIRG